MRYLITNLHTPERDLIEAALRGFESIEVDYAEGTLALDRIRSRTYSAIILGLGTSIDSNDNLFDRLREAASSLPILVVAPDSATHRLREEKARGKVFGFLGKPIETVALYRALSRLVARGESLAAS
jgi:DNA-binding NarL/FixJ family response regulator